MVMLSIMHMNFFSRAALSFSRPWGMSSALIPGIMAMTWLRGPIFMMFWNWSYMMRSVNCPSCSFCSSSGCCSMGITSWILSMNPDQSPSPSSRLTNALLSNASNSSMCSPVPMKRMGDLVAATLHNESDTIRPRHAPPPTTHPPTTATPSEAYALRAPPPLACPSILVMMTAPTATLALKA